MTLFVYGSLVTFFVIALLRGYHRLQKYDDPAFYADDDTWDLVGKFLRCLIVWLITMASGGMAIWLLGKILLAYSGLPY